MKLGVKIANKPSECTHLVTRDLTRTEKLLCALPVARYVLSQEWALDSAKKMALQRERAVVLI